jgi:transposase
MHLSSINEKEGTTDMDLNRHYALLLGLGDEWRVEDVTLSLGAKRVDVYLEYAAKAAQCPECGRLGPVHDQQEERTWRHLDTMQFETLVHARTPRVRCPGHGVKVVELPWAAKHSRFTLMFEAFAVDVLKAAKSVRHAQELLRLGWRQTHDIMEAAVERGLARRGADEVAFVGMDEKSFLHGKEADDFACVMTDLDNHRILDVARGRSEEGAKALVDKALNPAQQYMVCGVAMDMSAPFRKAVRDRMPNADVVYDRFHVEMHLNEGVDRVRRHENRVLAKRNDKRLAKTKYLWLTGLEHLSDEAAARRRDLLRCGLDTGVAFGLKEAFSYFWKSRDKDYARAFFDDWFEEVAKAGLKPMAKVARTLKRHLDGLLAWFDCRITNSLTEGYNATIQALKASARGFRNFENFRTVILFYCGKLDMRPDFVRCGLAL